MEKLALFLRVLLFLFKMLLYKLIQAVYYRLNGVHRKRCEVMESSCSSDNIAEVLTITDRTPLKPVIPIELLYFTTWHEKFVPLSYIDKPNVTLFKLTPTTTYFVEVDTHEKMYDTRRFPFFVLEQYDLSKRIIAVPIKQFIKKFVERPVRCQQVAWIFHTCRCGSTAAVQALNTVPEITVISEPSYQHDFLFHHKMAEFNLDVLAETAEVQQVQLACVNFMLKDFTEKSKVCIKTTGLCEYLTLLPVILKNYPQHKIINMYRDGKATANSMYKGFSTPYQFYKGASYIKQHTGMMEDFELALKMVFSGGMVNDARQSMPKGVVDLYFLMYLAWVGNMTHFFKHAGNINQLLLILYDDFLADQQGVLHKMFDFLDISAEHIPAALEALKEDSQKGTDLARDRVSQTNWQRDERIVEKCEQLLAKYHLPSFDTKFRVKPDLSLEIISK